MSLSQEAPPLLHQAALMVAGLAALIALERVMTKLIDCSLITALLLALAVITALGLFIAAAADALVTAVARETL